MLVSYTYRADDASPEDSKADTSTAVTPSSKLKREASGGGAENMKTFSFYTVVDLGSIAPKETAAKVEKQERRESVQTVGVYN
jgi:dynactin 4